MPPRPAAVERRERSRRLGPASTSIPRTILVTGANRGRGLATAERLARVGHRLVLNARDDAKARATAEASFAPAGLGPHALGRVHSLPLRVMQWSPRFIVLVVWLAMHLGACRLSTPSAEDYVLVGGSGESGTSTGGGVGEGESSSSGGMQSDGGSGEASTTSGTGGSGASDGSSSDGSASASTDGTETDTGMEVICGDGVVEGDEACDGAALQGETCQSQGFDGGMLACAADCSSLDLGGCGVCGNGMIDGDEACDGIDLGGQTCGPGFDSGTLACLADCSAFDFDGCGTCGNAVIDGNEVCDGVELQGHTCVSEGFDSGALACATDCGAFVTGGCGACGNDVIDGDEVCDGVDVGGQTCVSQGFDSGTLGCAGGCGAFDFGGCGMCGNGMLEGEEQCDGPFLGMETCASQGFSWGTLACTPGCAYDVGGCTNSPEVPVLMLSFSPVKRFDFSWAAVAGADYYQLDESAAPGEPFVPLGGEVVGTSVSFEMPLHFRWQASYRLWACNAAGCTESAVVDVVGSLAEAVGYVKASNTGVDDRFGMSVVLSGDGSTLAVGAYVEDSNATGVGGNQADNSASNSGAVYVYARDGLGTWSQQAYVKASNTGANDRFGWSVALSGDGSTLAVGALGEASNATGVGDNQVDNSAPNSGAVYVYTRDGLGAWSQQAYVKASNTGAGDSFGLSVALSGDGSTLAVGAYGEDSSATDIGGDQADNSAVDSGAVYVYARDGLGAWSQQAYVKASNTGASDYFGWSVVLSGDGSTLAVGAYLEDSNATGVGGNPADNSASSSGAVYVYTRDGLGAWSQQAYVKASNTNASDNFGWSVVLSGDGSTLAVGAHLEDSNATGVGGNPADNSASASGAVYVYTRDGLGVWSQQAYVKASNTSASDYFGWSVVLSGDGSTLAVGADFEGSNATGVGGNQADNSASSSGAVYVYTRDGLGAWSQQAYVKASNTGAYDYFGYSVALSGDGSTLAVGAYVEDSNATGVGGDQANNNAFDSGAVYFY